MASVKERLIVAKALINTPEKWGKGPDSFPLEREDDGETCLCAHGALYEAMNGDWGIRADGVVRALQNALPDGWGLTPDYNDDPNTTHDDIMALFDRAIAAQDDAP